MPNRLDEIEAAVRRAIADDRLRNELTWRQLAAELGVPKATLHAFGVGRIPLGETLKPALSRRYPQLTPLLAELSLAWMQRHEAVRVLPSPDQPQEAPR